MAHITRRGTPTTPVGELPAVGSKAPGFTLTAADLAPDRAALGRLIRKET